MVKMLINASRKSDEVRLAVVGNENKLLALDVESREHESTKGNIYVGKVVTVKESLEAAFVDCGRERHGFLPFREISEEYYTDTDKLAEGEKPTIDKVIKPGQYIVVQVDKEERGAKGAALTTYLTLAGCYLVLMPNNPKSGGISRRIEGEERQEMRELLDNLRFPKDMGLIMRTAGLGRNLDELQWDVDVLLNQWEAIKTSVVDKEAPFLMFREADVVLRAIRDYLRQNVVEIIIDDKATYAEVSKYIKLFRPGFSDKLKLHDSKTPLFNKYNIEDKIQTAYDSQIELPSGGSIVINHTEALTAIDINSAKATQGKDIEETALKTNLEAAEEVALQLRLRDVGGLVVIDFIDMSANKNQRAVEQLFKECLEVDRARIQVGRISRFGLLEMSRQRMKPSLGESDRLVCVHCKGQGYTRSPNATASTILRETEAKAAKQHCKQIQIQTSIEVATYLINEKRASVVELEHRYKVDIIIIPDSNVSSLEYTITVIEKSSKNDEIVDSYSLIPKSNKAANKREFHSSQPKSVPSAAIEHMSTVTQAPKHVEKSAISIVLKKIWEMISKRKKPKPKSKQKKYYRNRRYNKPHSGRKRNYRNHDKKKSS